MKFLLLPILVIISSCAALVGGVAGGAAGAHGANSGSIQTVMLRSRYKADCNSTSKNLIELISNNEDILEKPENTPHICSEIKSSEPIFNGCLKSKRKEEYRLAYGNKWSGYKYFLIQIEKNAKTCDLYLYTRLDYEILGNPLSPTPDCKSGMNYGCEKKLKIAYDQREKITKFISENSKIEFGDVLEEKILNYYRSESEMNAFEK